MSILPLRTFPPQTHVGIFLKKAGILLLGFGAETYTGALARLFVPIEKFLREQKVLPERNIGRFLATLNILVSDYLISLDNPSASDAERTKRKKVLESWLKFNGALLYASQYPFSTELVSHFLYGEGKEMNISDLLSNQIKAMVNESMPQHIQEEMEITPSMSTYQLIEKVFQEMLNSRPRIPQFIDHVVYEGGHGPGKTEQTKGIYVSSLEKPKEYFVGHPSQSLLGKKVQAFGIATIRNGNAFYGLGQFTVYMKGQVTSVEKGITLTQPELGISDRYNWTTGEGFYAAVSVGEVITQLGLDSIFADQRFNELKNQELRIDDEEGNVLIQAKLAHEFDISARFSGYRETHIQNTHFTQPPDEFVQKKNILLTKVS